METKARNFKDIFQYQYTYKTEQEVQYFKVKDIVIPMIQRDYAQGRKDARTQDVRKRFLEALHEAVTQKPVTLDFIYGDIDTDGILTPLDGQQRLTTLFLLHWYAAKQAGIPAKDYAFLHHFTYQTRSSARMFCEKLVDFDPDTAVFDSQDKTALSQLIIDQPWFPFSWEKDATVASMLVMLDAIQQKFQDVPNLWEKLQEDAITFYFLPIKDMGLTDELYIKMNSRGKPLTDFEHFKAELERRLRQTDKEMAKRIIRKIDLDWTDLLWPHRGDNNIIDDEFLRYFHFICDIICYREGGTTQGRPSGSFDLLDLYFRPQKASFASHVNLLEEYFDAWRELHGSQTKFVTGFLSKDHRTNKVKLWDDKTDLFCECLDHYGETRDGGNRRFPLNKTVLFYAFHVYLLHRSTITSEEFTDRLRIIVHLINNSQAEISDSTSRAGRNHMQAILQQVDSIVKEGKILTKGINLNFNENQLQEEKKKIAWLAQHPGEAENLHALEDHELLYGQISIVGLGHPELFPRFAKLFDCDWDLVDCALMATGDYRQRDKNEWRYQLGSSGANGGAGRRMDVAWKNLFHRTLQRKSFDATSEYLQKLLKQLPAPTDPALRDCADAYLTDCKKKKHFDWRYYYIKYPVFRRGRFGTYEWKQEDKPYECFAFWSESQESSWMYQPFLYAIDKENSNKEEYNTVLRYRDYAVACENDRFALYKCENISQVREAEHPPKPVRELLIPQNQGIDTEDRIVMGKSWLENVRQELSI